MADIKNLRTDYNKSQLNEADLVSNPHELFKIWIEDALSINITDPNAFVLSTVDALGYPSSRVVLLRDYSENGLVFFTNYDSFKGKNVVTNNVVCMNFFWSSIERQIRVLGKVKRISEAKSDEYFESRPYESKIGAWASKQSEVIASRKVLEEQVEYYKKKFPNDVPRPKHWGGYIIEPNKFEFWQGRSSRLHDRINYYREKNGVWKVNRLAP